MPATIQITDKQRDKIIEEMYVQKDMLTVEEVGYLATQLNAKINLPFANEKTEQKIYIKFVTKVDRLLYESLPNELYGLIKDSTDGISEEEADKLINILSTRINNKFDIKYIPEWVEQEIFEFLIGLIVKAMRKGYRMLPE